MAHRQPFLFTSMLRPHLARIPHRCSLSLFPYNRPWRLQGSASKYIKYHYCLKTPNASVFQNKTRDPSSDRQGHHGPGHAAPPHSPTMLIPFLFRQPVPGASCPGHTDPAVGSYCYNHLPECSSLNSLYIPL